MKEERLLVLNMLNEGKINTEEACKLLEALGSSAQSGEFGEKVSKYADSFKKKAVKLAKNAEPTVKKYAEAVGEKFEDIKSGIKNKTKSDDIDEENIVVDETETDGEAEDNSDDDSNA